MGNQTMTVGDLYSILKTVVASGYGECKVICADGDIAKDDYVFRPGEGVFEFRGHIYNLSDFERCAVLKEDIEKAFEKFHSQGR